ncbi:hypothetical protein B0J14DRAFT_698189 [Halenospora varia]|nr:hypothetical protein B0J14DRAFT_698189 [Halenospora varia]
MEDSYLSDEGRELLQLRRENELLKEENEELGIRLIGLTHKSDQAPGGEIRDQLEKICSAIETWIDYASQDREEQFRRSLETALRSDERGDKQGPGERLKILSLGPHFPQHLDLKSKSTNPGMLHYFILSTVIGQIIFDKILKSTLPSGTTTAQAAFIKSIEEEMQKAGKTPLQISEWRAETLKAFCASASFKQNQKEKLNDFKKDLRFELSYWLSSRIFPTHQARLDGDIVDPAARLSMKMHFSTRKYVLSWDPHAVQPEDKWSWAIISSWGFKELSSWRSVTPREDPENSYHFVHPGLTSIDQKTKKSLELVKPVVIAFKRREFKAKRNKRSSNTSPERTDSPTKDNKDGKSKPKEESLLSRGVSWGVANLTRRKTEESFPPPKRADSTPSASRRPSQVQTTISKGKAVRDPQPISENSSAAPYGFAQQDDYGQYQEPLPFTYAESYEQDLQPIIRAPNGQILEYSYVRPESAQAYGQSHGGYSRTLPNQEQLALGYGNQPRDDTSGMSGS